MKVLIIPEDPSLDQYVLKPIVERLFEDLERSATVDVLTDPHLRGASEALDAKTVAGIVEDYPMIDLFLLMVDRDCDRSGHVAKAAARERDHARLVACLAIQEVEVWMLAVFPTPPVSIREIRAHCDPKEAYAEPFLTERGWSRGVGKGRKQAMTEGLRGSGYRRLLSRCRELCDLRERLAERLAS